MNFYPFHIGDYASATRHLSWDEDAAYRRLLDVYYTTEKPLPVELRQVFRLVLASSDSQREAVQTVLEEFFEQTAEGWINRRADAEIAVMRDKQDKQRAKANKRWQKPDAEPGIASALPQHTESDAAASESYAVAMPPTPTPTPTPTPKEGRADRSASATSRPTITLQTYLADCRARSVKPIPDDHSIRRYCADAGIADEMLQVAWIKFREKHTTGTDKAKRQKDWPATFANCVRDRWYRLWWVNDQGLADWTPEGLQERRVIEARMAAKQTENTHEHA